VLHLSQNQSGDRCKRCSWSFNGDENIPQATLGHFKKAGTVAKEKKKVVESSNFATEQKWEIL
jgi:hypothetical protein